MTITARPATLNDAQALCDVINPIITKGGTTAHQTLFTPDRMRGHYIAPDNALSCMVAQDGDTVLGLQSLVWALPKDNMPEGWTIIASFVSQSAQGRGVGQILFAATQSAARQAGAIAIDATIKSYNTGGLAYYSGLGFTDYRTSETAISKRFDLRAD